MMIKMPEPMVATETFPNAPITEALLDINVVLPAETTLPTLLKFQDAIRENFPQKQDRFLQTFEFHLGKAPEVRSPSNAVDGYLFLSPDKTKIVQSRLDGFTFNKLKPYDKWQSFSEEAKGLWQHYISVARPVNVRRVGLRYINSIDLPLPIDDLDKYFTTSPRTPPSLSQGIHTFFLQVSIPHGSSAAKGLVTQTFKPFQPGGKVLSYILDIDVSFQFEVQAPDTGAIWNHMDLLHDFKNDIFFSSITEETKKLFR